MAKTAGIRLDWVWSGDGPMQVASAGPGGDFLLIPRHQLDGVEGTLREAEEEIVSERLMFHKRWLARELGVPERHLAVVTARGDSMEPHIRDGAVLIIDTGKTELRDDGVYVLRRDHHLQVKRLQRGAGDQVIIRSDNPAYPPVTVELPQAAALQVVGRVLWVGGRL